MVVAVLRDQVAHEDLVGAERVDYVEAKLKGVADLQTSDRRKSSTLNSIKETVQM